MINCTKIKISKNFEKNVLKHFPKTDKDIFLDVVGMKRGNGSGAYKNYVGFWINNEYFELSQNHNDSEGWDNYCDWIDSDRVYQNWAKSTVLYLLAENKDKIKEFFEN